MHKSLRNHKLEKILLFCFIVCIGIPVFIQPVNAGPGGGPAPPSILKCKVQAKAYSDDILRFKFFFEIWGYVEEWLGGYRLYYFRLFDLGSSDECSDIWVRQWLRGYPTYDSSPGGGTIKGYNQTEVWRIYHKDNASIHLDFELSAKVHIFFGHSGSLHIVTSGDEIIPPTTFEFEVFARDTTYDFNPWTLLLLKWGTVLGGNPRDTAR